MDIFQLGQQFIDSIIRIPQGIKKNFILIKHPEQISQNQNKISLCHALDAGENKTFEKCKENTHNKNADPRK